MAEQMNMFDQMGLGLPPIDVACDWIRDGWLGYLEELAEYQTDYADEPDFPMREETFDGFVLEYFRTHCGWCGLGDFRGFCRIDFSPRGVRMERPDGSGVEISKAEILRHLGVKENVQG